MSTTGLVAHNGGKSDHTLLAELLKRSLLLATAVALLLIALSIPIQSLMAYLSNANEAVLEQANSYFSIRIFSAPAALCNLVLLGWMLGVHYGRGPFYLLLITNITNIVLDIYFVVFLDWGVAGAAWASLIADYIALAFALLLVAQPAKKQGVNLAVKAWLSVAKLLDLVSLNRDIFIRSLALQLCFSFMTLWRTYRQNNLSG